MVLRGINCVNVFKIISSDKIVVILINFKIKLHYKTPPMKYFYINFRYFVPRWYSCSETLHTPSVAGCVRCEGGAVCWLPRLELTEVPVSESRCRVKSDAGHRPTPQPPSTPHSPRPRHEAEIWQLYF